MEKAKKVFAVLAKRTRAAGYEDAVPALPAGGLLVAAEDAEKAEAHGKQALQWPNVEIREVCDYNGEKRCDLEAMAEVLEDHPMVGSLITVAD